MAQVYVSVAPPEPIVEVHNNHAASPDGCGMMAITAGMATAMSGSTAAGFVPRIRAQSGLPTAGNTVTAVMCWWKVTGSNRKNNAEESGVQRPALFLPEGRGRFIPKNPPTSEQFSTSRRNSGVVQGISMCAATGTHRIRRAMLIPRNIRNNTSTVIPKLPTPGG